MKISLIYWGEDWEGLYIDGILKIEGHRISVRDVADALGIEYEYKDVDYSNDEFYLPENIEDLKNE